ncbi:hypothetical protein HY948_04090 [Candidatus Gottesmanbacteria bacterium]|nr:hypothetical protein [Candidatus Gottesmanbacteria bacterium]
MDRVFDPAAHVIDMQKPHDALFEFLSYAVNRGTDEISFFYRVDLGEKTIRFTETIGIPGLASRLDTVPGELTRRVLESLQLMLGISYWKIYCPRNIRTGVIKLSKSQAQFWNTVYTKGLGEFFYRNSIDPRGLIQFPYDVKTRSTKGPLLSVAGSILQLGGGKDSVVTGELLKECNMPFVPVSLNTSAVQREVAGVMGKSVLDVTRVIDPDLFVLNKGIGVYNGHIPISAVYAFVDVLVAVLYGYQYIIASNEESANFGNILYHGEEINHQWSKSWEFEQLFQQYIIDNLTPSISYFSMLRPLKEAAIVKMFVRYKQYFSVFTSCNANFRINYPQIGSRWCGECPKCAFVFLLLSAFMAKNEVFNIFQKNLFSDSGLFSLYEELLGLARFKPFECVGTPEESQWAFWRVMENHEYDTDAIVKLLRNALPFRVNDMNMLEKELFEKRGVHAIPKSFASVLSRL